MAADKPAKKKTKKKRGQQLGSEKRPAAKAERSARSKPVAVKAAAASRSGGASNAPVKAEPAAAKSAPVVVEPVAMATRVQRLAMFGFGHDADVTRGFLRAPARHVAAWLATEPRVAELIRLLGHLERLAQDGRFPREPGSPYTIAHHLALRRQLAAWLYDDVVDRLGRGRGAEALIHRDYTRGLGALDDPAALLDRLTLLVPLADDLPPAPVADDAPQPDVAALAHWVAEQGVAHPGEGRDADSLAEVLAAALAQLEAIWTGTAARIVVPLAGTHAGVVELAITCVFEGEERAPAADGDALATDDAIAGDGADPIDANEPESRASKRRPITQRTTPRAPRITQRLSPRVSSGGSASSPVDSPAVQWHGLPVDAETQRSVARLLHRLAGVGGEASRAGAADGIAPGFASRRVARVFVVVRESPYRPLDAAVAGIAGRSIELAALLAVTSALDLGSLPKNLAATGQVEPDTGQLAAITGVREKVAALFALAKPAGGPAVSVLVCPGENADEAERAARALDYPLQVIGVSRAVELGRADLRVKLGLGRDPWEPYLAAVEKRGERAAASLNLTLEQREDWRARLTELDQSGERTIVLPAPFSLPVPSVRPWMFVLAGLLASLRDTSDGGRSGRAGRGPRERGGIPVVLEPSADDPSLFPMLLRAVRDTVPTPADEPSPADVANAYRTPGAFWLLLADPDDDSPIIPREPSRSHRHLTLTKRHPAYRHRWCAVARDLHQLVQWRRDHATLSRL